MAKKTATPRPRRWGAALVLLVVVASLGGLGAWHAAGLRVTHIDVRGARHADVPALRALAGLDTGLVLLDVDPRLVADRLRRHPWVAEAHATRLPTGTVRLAVDERVPVLRVIDARGRPAHYLDAAGHGLPPPDSAAFDVPLLRGFEEAYHPVRPVENPTVRALLQALAGLDPETDALLAEFELRRDDVWLFTTPADDRGPVAVRLGRGGFRAKLHRLRAFWQQAVLAQPEKDFSLIDLRFAGQIVTRE